MGNTAFLSAAHVDFSYGRQRVLTDVNLELPKGKFISIIGPNGSGKTTLFNLLCGLEKPENGQITYLGENVCHMDLRKRARQFAVIRQREENRFPFTCIETVILGLHPHRGRFEKLGSRQLAQVREIMELTDTYQFSAKRITQISGGEMQRVLFARAIIQRPQVLFLDEAMSDMDISAKVQMINVLQRLIQEEGITVIAINHDINMAYRFSDEIIALKEGSIRAQGKPEDVMTEPFFRDVFSISVEVVAEKGFFIT